MKMWKSSSLLLFCCAALLWNCSPPVANKRDFAEALLLSESGRTVRGSLMGHTANDVRGRETYTLRLDTDSMLVYEGTVEYDGREVAVTLFYSFDVFGLFEIQMDIYPGSVRDAERIFLALKGKLTMMYGRPDMLATGMRFSTFSPSNNVVEITLIDDTAEQGDPYVSLNFLEPLDDEI